MRYGACSSNASNVAVFATSTTWNSVSSRSGVASTRTSLTEQFDSGMFDYACVSVPQINLRSVQTTATLSTNVTVTDVFVYKLLRRLFHIGNFCFWVSFLPRCMKCRRGLAMRILSVCPSVSLSVRRVIPDKMEERSVQRFLYHTKEHLA